MSSLQTEAKNFTRILQELDQVSIGNDLNEYLLRIVTFLSVMFQAIIIWMIYAKSPQSMKEYRFYLIGITVPFIKYFNNKYLKKTFYH